MTPLAERTCCSQVGNLPEALESEAALRPVFERFGVVIAVTVRYRREVDEQGRAVVSWALVSFRSPSGAQAAMAAWAPQGKLAKIASKHAADLAPPESDTAWIGGIPDGFCRGDIDEVNKTFAESCKQFGEVISATVRVKPGVNKSWALCTFKEPASARKCVSEGMTLPDGDGSQLSMKCKISDVESNLKKGTTGALASMAKKHEEEVEAAKALMTKMWSNVRQLFCVPPHTFWFGLLTAMYGAHACASRHKCDFPACVVRADGFQQSSWRRQAGWCRAQTYAIQGLR